MLSCFPKFSYQQLQEDADYSHFLPETTTTTTCTTKDSSSFSSPSSITSITTTTTSTSSPSSTHSAPLAANKKRLPLGSTETDAGGHRGQLPAAFTAVTEASQRDKSTTFLRKSLLGGHLVASSPNSGNSTTARTPVVLPNKIEPKSGSRLRFSRSSNKGTEHLEQALRKSAENPPDASLGQRYIKLPTLGPCSRRNQSPQCVVTPSPSSSSASSPALSRSLLLSPTVAPCRPKLPPAFSSSSGSCSPSPPRPVTRHPGMKSKSRAPMDEVSSTLADKVWSSPPVQQQQQSQPQQSQPLAANGGSNAAKSAGVGGSGNTSGFIEKPPRGWLHPDQQIAESGISYRVRYVGSLEINTSMRSLDFETRSRIAKECICRVCEESGLKKNLRSQASSSSLSSSSSPSSCSRPEKRSIARMLADKPNLAHAKADVNLTITSSFLNLSDVSTGEVIAKHEMPNISFASGGEDDTLDLVAYVAKGQRNTRACYVLECASASLAQDVITTIGQAFELRFKEFLKRAPRNLSERLDQQAQHQPQPHQAMNGKVGLSGHETGGALGGDPDREYYNDLPGKLPPDMPESSSLSPTTATAATNNIMSVKNARPQAAPRTAGPSISRKQLECSANLDISPTSPNLIDLNTDLPPTLYGCASDATSSTSSPSSSGAPLPTLVQNSRTEPEYVNCKEKVKSEQDTNSCHDVKDPFDMQPFESSKENSSNLAQLIASHATRDLKDEEWFHGSITRQESESLVVLDGDFLVRASQGSPNQYVLTGMQGSIKKHLLLVDPEGVVRTKDKTFNSVSHLINYHRDNGLPIISAESALVLRSPIVRKA